MNKNISNVEKKKNNNKEIVSHVMLGKGEFMLGKISKKN